MFTKGGFHSINWQCISTLRKKSGKSEFFIAWENGEISANSVCVRSLDFSRSGDNFFFKLPYHSISGKNKNNFYTCLLGFIRGFSGGFRGGWGG